MEIEVGHSEHMKPYGLSKAVFDLNPSNDFRESHNVSNRLNNISQSMYVTCGHVVYLDSGEGDQKHKNHSIPVPVLI